MRIKRPSGPTLVTCVLLVLLPALAVLQYRWVGQVSVAERERMQRNLRVAAEQFREGFDGEIVRASLNLQVGADTARDGESERYSERYDTWLDTAAHPEVIAAIFVVDDGDGGGLRLRRWNPEAHAFDPTPWPPAIERVRPELERQHLVFTAGRPAERGTVFRDEESLIVTPIRRQFPIGLDRRQTIAPPVFGFTVLELDLQYIREQMLPELAQRHFTHPDGDVYRVAVTAADDPASVLYRSDPDAPIDAETADATTPLLGRPDPALFFARPGTGGGGQGNRRDFGRRPGTGDASGLEPRRGRPDDFGRWRLIVQHQSGSLEAAVGQVRRRNLAISFGVLLLLSVSVGLLTATARRAQHLAQQQMEFVAGVSHELRTPVSVIRAAAENLSQGVVTGGDRVKRYGETIGTEARRLGEMVERVLQYAGIESGLGLGERVPLSPAELVETAVDSVMPHVGQADVVVHREIAPNLPPVNGDGHALRSAVENLIANAVKYGGRDRWVGIKVEHGRERRRSEVRITVSDHGAGIPASELPHIFDPFYRGADATTRQIHGNGLGLSLVKRIVSAHGGRITVTTRAGAGSAFTIALPAAAPDPRPTPVAGNIRAAHT